MKYGHEDIWHMIKYNLFRRGCSFTGVSENQQELMPGEDLPAEDLIMLILQHKDPRCSYMIPLIIKKNLIDYSNLVQQAKNRDVVEDLNYVLNRTYELFIQKKEDYHQYDELKSAIGVLRTHKSSRPHIMTSPQMPNLEKVLLSLQTPEEKKCNVLGRLLGEGFEHSYLTYQ